MSFKKLDESQSKAVYELDKHLYVTASAGTGKTEVLTRRFMHILEKKKCDISNILALTFTEKAANEMKERIFHFIVQKIKQTDSIKEATYWKKIKKSFNQNNISTLHSFCAKLIREHSIELKIDPDYKVIDKTELRFEFQKWMKDKISHWLYYKDSDEQKNVDEITSLLDTYSFNELKGNITELFKNHTMVMKVVIPFYKQFNNEYDYSQYLRQKFSEYRKPKLKKVLTLKPIIELYDNLDFFSSIYKDKEKAPFAKYVIILEEILLYIKEGQIHPKISTLYKSYDIYKSKKEKTLKVGDSKHWSEDELIDLNNKIEQLISPLRLWLPEILFKDVNLEEERLFFLISQKLLNLYTDLINSISTASNTNPILDQWLNRSLLTFDDLQTTTLELFSPQTNEDASNKSETLLELWTKYKYIMIDESQDIDEVQKEIIASLTDFEGNSSRLFLVGDPKQSIYKFRGANISTFKELTHKIEETHKESYHLDINYRSQQGLVDFVNQLFRKLMAVEGESFEVQYQKPVQAFREKQNHNVELILYKEDKSDSKDITDKEQEAENIAHRILALVHDKNTPTINYGDIAILFRALTDVSIYEKALAHYNIPYRILSGRHFYKLQEIVDCINLLRYIDNPHDDLSFCAILRSPFCSVSDYSLFWLTHNEENPHFGFTQKLKQFQGNPYLSQSEKVKLESIHNLIDELKNKKDRIKIYELLRLALDKTAYFPVLLSMNNGEQKKSNVEYLLRKIKKLEEQRPWSLFELISYLEMLDQTNQEENFTPQNIENNNAVSIMSIHKSKGTEFPVVILANIDRSPKAHGSQIHFSTELGLGIKSYSPEKKKEVKSFVYQYLQDEDKRKELAENKRLLYVAVTRAKDYLVLSGKAKVSANPNIYKFNSNWLEYLIYSEGSENKQLYKAITQDSISSNHSIIPYGSESISLYWNYKYEPLKQDEKDFLSKELKITDSISFIHYDKQYPLEKLNATALVEYEKCPRKFYYKFIQNIHELYEGIGPYFRDKIKQNHHHNEGQEQWSKDIPLNLVGNIVHQILEKYDQKTHDLVQVIFTHIKTLKLAALSQQNQCEQIITQIQNLLDQFIGSNTYDEIKWSQEHFPNDYYNELNFLYQIEDTQVEGSIDKVFMDKDEQITLIDYKTNRFPNPEHYQKLLEKRKQEYQHQMQVYYLALYYLFGQVHKGKLFFLDIQKEAEPLGNKQKNIINIEEDLKKLIQQVNSNYSSHSPLSSFYTKPSEDCDFCGYWMCENRRN